MNLKLAPALLLALGLTHCDKKPTPEADRGAAPPPIQSSRPGACASGGGTVKDKVSAGYFPRNAGGYCVDPNGEARAYGESAPADIDKVCTELFDGECETYKEFGLKRVVTLRYIDGKGSPGAVNVNLSHFGSKEGAFAFFTKRVVADADPLESAPAKLEAGGMAAMGTGIAYVWRDEHVAELSYTNELEAPDQLKKSADAVIPAIAKQIGDKLPGDKLPPKAVQALPTASLIPMGISYTTSDALGIKGVGAGAIGFYKDGDKRWRVMSLARPDEDGAKDVVKTLKKQSGAKGLKGVTFDGATFEQREDDSSPKIAWVIGRKGDAVFGIGDEENVLSNDQTAEAAAKVSLSETEKLDHLKKLVEGGGAPAP
jgi:hypothetical protein